MKWIDVRETLPSIGEEVFVWVDGHRSPAWNNSYPLVAYRSAYGEWLQERHRNADALVGVTHWAHIKRPNPKVSA